MDMDLEVGNWVEKPWIPVILREISNGKSIRETRKVLLEMLPRGKSLRTINVILMVYEQRGQVTMTGRARNAKWTVGAELQRKVKEFMG